MENIQVKQYGPGSLAMSGGLPENTLQINTDVIVLKNKELDIDFQIESNKFKDIDTIIVNGYKYIKKVD